MPLLDDQILARNSSSPVEPGAQTATPAIGAISGLHGPVRHLVAAAELLDRQRLTPEARTCARAILHCSRMVLSVLEDLRQLGDVVVVPPAPPAPVLLSDMIEEVEALWRLQTAPSAGRLLISCAAPSRLILELSSGAVKQLINTLISRGLAFARAGVVEVVIDVEMQGDAVILTGVLHHAAAAVGALIYDSGLPLASAIAAGLGGRLVRMANAGQGETVEFALPSQIVVLEDLVGPDEEDSPLPARTHILIVDDNATNRTVASALCEMFGCTTQTADDGVEAVEAARASRFDLILMDIKMPRMDGIEATQAIRRLPGKLGRVPIVALTANGDADSTRVYLSCGMDAVVEKPIKPDRLLETMQWALDPERDATTSNAAVA